MIETVYICSFKQYPSIKAHARKDAAVTIYSEKRNDNNDIIGYYIHWCPAISECREIVLAGEFDAPKLLEAISEYKSPLRSTDRI